MGDAWTHALNKQDRKIKILHFMIGLHMIQYIYVLQFYNIMCACKQCDKNEVQCRISGVFQVY